MSVLWLVVFTGILVALQGVLFSIFDLKKLRYERRFSTDTAP